MLSKIGRQSLGKLGCYFSRDKLGIQNDANIIMVRHAESQFNLGCRVKAQQMGISHQDWFTKEQNEEFCRSAPYNPKYIDCSITPKGRTQCLNARNELEEVPVDLVIVSPKTRALQTCSLLFQGRQVPIIVDKVVSEACRFSCDAVRPAQYSNKIRTFKQFTFPAHIDEEYVYNINPQQLEHYENYCRTHGIDSQQDRDLVLMRMMNTKEVYEGDEELRNRAWRAKLKLKDLVQKNGYKNICLVSHWYFLTYLCSRSFGPSSQNLQYENVQNCKPFIKKLSWLLQVK